MSHGIYRHVVFSPGSFVNSQQQKQQWHVIMISNTADDVMSSRQLEVPESQAARDMCRTRCRSWSRARV